jgi:hypothetical protein
LDRWSTYLWWWIGFGAVLVIAQFSLEGDRVRHSIAIPGSHRDRGGADSAAASPDRVVRLALTGG